MNTRTITEELAQRGDIFYSLSMGDMAGTQHYAVPVHVLELDYTPEDREWLTKYLTTPVAWVGCVVDLLALDEYIFRAEVGGYKNVKLTLYRLVPFGNGSYVDSVNICEEHGRDLDSILDLTKFNNENEQDG